MTKNTQLSGKRILVVEDEMLAAMELADILESRECTIVGPVASLKNALPLAEGEEYDAAILDITLRDGDVFPLAQWLKDREIPFIFATAYGSSAGLTKDFMDYTLVPKPYPEQRLVRALDQAIRDRTPTVSVVAGG
ncbi:MAG: response regulator [Rhodospirillales bacterium]